MADEFLTSGGRMGAAQHFYYSICERAYLDFLKSVEERRSEERRLSGLRFRPNDEPEQPHADLSKAIFNANAAAIEVIVFAGMCLEAAIYDYAAWHLDDAYVQKHLDKLDLLSKWMVIPKLVTQRELPTGRPSYEKLKKLIRMRNTLIHYKSGPLPRTGKWMSEAIKRYEKAEQDIQAGCREALRAIILLSLDMDYIFGDLTLNPLPSFSKSKVNYRYPRPKELEVLVSECRGIHARSRKREENR